MTQLTSRKLEGPIVIRFNEMQTRGKAVEDFQQAMFAARAFFVEAHKNNTEALDAAKEATPEKPVAPPKYTEAELSNVEKLLKDNEVWMDEKMQKQVKLDSDPRADPVIFTADLNEKGKNLQMTVSLGRTVMTNDRSCVWPTRRPQRRRNR